MSECFICQRPLGKDDVYEAKVRAVQTLIRSSVKRKKKEHQRMLENVQNITVHRSCYKQYTELRFSIDGLVRKDDDENNEGANEQLETESVFDFAKNCFFCGEKFPSDIHKIPHNKRNKIFTLTHSKTAENILKILTDRDDKISRSILQRVNSVPDLIAAGARYHSECSRRYVYRKPLTGGQKGRPTGNKVDDAMNDIYSYLAENSNECQFSLTELMAQVRGDFCPSILTVRTQLKKKYVDDILVIGSERGTVVCFKNTGYKVISDAWYAQRSDNIAEERLRVVRESAAIIREDIRSAVYDTSSYPPADEFLQNAESEVPESLRAFLSDVIRKGKRFGTNHSLQSVNTKCISIAHAIVSAVRPRSFNSSVKIGVGAFLYKKFGSKTLIDILSSLGFSASYSEVVSYENSCINAGESTVLEGAFSQFVFDNADFNIKTIDGHGTFHAMGGIHCVTPKTCVAKDAPIPRIMEKKNAAKVAQMGMVPVLSYTNHALAGLQSIQVADIDNLHPLLHDIVPTTSDLMWLYGKWSYFDGIPGWNGFMEESTADLPYEISRIICLPFINAPPSDYDTILTSLAKAVEKCQLSNQQTCFVTFDQPLYWKARDIVAAANPSFGFDNVFIRLGGFHLLMSFMGSIGYIMQGSGIEQLFYKIYAENCVQKIISGHAYSRAVRAHILTHLALTKIIMENIDFSDEERNEMNNFMDILNRPIILTADGNNAVKSVAEKFRLALLLLENRGPTAKLWVQYYRMVTLLKHFIEAERTGNWTLHLETTQKMLPFFHASGHYLYAKSAHLYIQDMLTLREKMLADEFERFTTGCFTIRRSNKFWSGIMSDQTIEQVLMRAFKVIGGLTQRKITDSSSASWILGMVNLQNICESIERFAGVCCATTEQHVDMRPTRIKRDNEDVEKLDMWLAEHNPFPITDQLLSIGTGVVGSTDINCHEAEKVGKEMMSGIINNTFGSITSKKKGKVQPLAVVNCSVIVDATKIPVNPLLLFQRICIVKHTDDDMKKYLEFELAPFPLSLFTAEGMRKGTKSTLYSAFEPLQTVVQPGQKMLHVIDGGYLLHKVVWGRLTTFDLICKKYVTYVQNNFSNDVTVVFDGYSDDANFAGTKTSERMRRSKMFQTIEIIFKEDTILQTSQEKFLAHDRNKERLIKMLSSYFRAAGIAVEQAFEDADTLIVKTAIGHADIYDYVEIVGEDIDLLILLTGLAYEKSNVFFHKPAKGKTPASRFSSASLKNESIAEHIFFLHAFSGCDTTSALYNIGKKKFMSILQKNPQLRSSAQLFKAKEIDAEVLASAGERFLIAVYGGDKNEASLNSLRFKHFAKSVTKSRFNLSTLPPTTSAAREHTFRAYLQIQTWMGNYKDPQEWGWRRTSNGLEPVCNNAEPVPGELLKILSCKCKGRCGTACGCRKAGLKCSPVCKNCDGVSCDNVASIGEDVIDNDDDVDFEDGPNLQFLSDDEEVDSDVNADVLNKSSTSQPLPKRSRMDV